MTPLGGVIPATAPEVEGLVEAAAVWHLEEGGYAARARALGACAKARPGSRHVPALDGDSRYDMAHWIRLASCIADSG